jgi:putative thioredoxin
LASLATAQSERASIEAFRRDVIDASQTALVLVDFWAEWCGPCKTLTPILERVVAATEGKAKLVKIDVDKNQSLAANFRIQSIPTVYAFLGGQPVDGFQGALSESEVKAFVERLLAAAPLDAAAEAQEADIQALADAARQAIAEDQAAQAAEMLAALLRELPEREDLAGLYAQALLAMGETDAAEAALAPVVADSKDAEVAKARAGLAVARSATPVDDLAGLLADVEAHPDDLAKRLELAGGLIARGDRDAAADQLLAIVQRDRGFQEQAAQQRLLTLFEAAGLSDPWSVKTRARLRSILFS